MAYPFPHLLDGLVGRSHRATVDAIVIAFAYLGAVFLIAGFAYVFLARETRGQTLEALDA